MPRIYKMRLGFPFPSLPHMKQRQSRSLAEPRTALHDSLGIDTDDVAHTSHENLLGNCFTNAVVNVSAMT